MATYQKEYRILEKQLKKRGYRQISEGSHVKFALKDTGFIVTVTRNCNKAKIALRDVEKNYKIWKNRVKELV